MKQGWVLSTWCVSLIFLWREVVYLNRTMDDTAVANPSEPAVSQYWWLVLLIAPLVHVIGITGVFDLGVALLPNLFADVLGFLFVLLSFGLWLLQIVAVYYDRRYVTTVSDWSPSVVYYLVVVFPIGILIAIIYLYERHSHIGIP